MMITFLLEYASFLLNSIEDGNQVDSIYTDFSKAFDRVRHELLLNEMSVSIEPARCMRIHKIRIGDAVSKDIKVASGVLLSFVLFVNRISEIFDYVCVLFYADDMKLFLPVSGCHDCLKIQSDLIKLLEWCDRNLLLLNIGKCQITSSCEVLIYAGWHRAQSSELHKRFGTIMDEKITFSEHVDVMVTNALRY
jgi:hypothetical protein